MANKRRPIKVTADSNLARILDDASDEPVLLERRGVVFHLSRQDAHSSIGYEPDEALVLRMLDATAGRWADMDVDHVIENVYSRARDGFASIRSQLMYLLDTDWIIQALTGREPARRTRRHLAGVPVFVSLISIGELYERAFVSANSQAHIHLSAVHVAIPPFGLERANHGALR